MRLATLLLLAGCLPDLGPRSAQAHAGRCGDCHTAQAEAFAHSRHGNADESDLFRALQAEAPDPEACDACHAPPDGFTCLTCHAAAGNQRTADGLLLHDPTGPVRGPRGRQEASPHDSTADAFLTDSALCGTCHQLEGDGAFHEEPYTRWQQSQAAAEGSRCQDCHMSPEPGVAAARPRGPVAEGARSARLADHGFVGLQGEPVALLKAGLTLEATEAGVRMTNHAGHALPDGAAFTRELWLEGRDTDGGWTGEVHALHPRLFDARGKATADPFAAAQVELRALAPDATREVAFEASDVCLRYRPVAADLSALVGLERAQAMVVTCVVR